MKFQEYQELALRTTKPMDSITLDAVHMVIGIVSESLELSQELNTENPDKEKVIKELGDIIWYISGLCAMHKYDFSRGMDGFINMELNEALSVITSAYKAHWIYNRVLPREEVQTAIYNIVFFLDELANQLDCSMTEVMERNIAKLKVRFPDNYQDTLANNKNEDAE